MPATVRKGRPEVLQRALAWLHLAVGLLILFRGLRWVGHLPSSGDVAGAPWWMAVTVWACVTSLGALGAGVGALTLRAPRRGPLRVLAALTAFWIFVVFSYVSTLLLPPTPPMSSELPLQDSERTGLAVSMVILLVCLSFWFWLDRWVRRGLPSSPSGGTA